MMGHDGAIPAVGADSSVRGRLWLRLSYDACARTLTVCVIAARDLAVQQTTPTGGRGGEADKKTTGDAKRPSAYVKIITLPRRS